MYLPGICLHLASDALRKYDALRIYAHIRQVVTESHHLKAIKRWWLVDLRRATLAQHPYNPSLYAMNLGTRLESYKLHF